MRKLAGLFLWALLLAGCGSTPIPAAGFTQTIAIDRSHFGDIAGWRFTINDVQVVEEPDAQGAMREVLVSELSYANLTTGAALSREIREGDEFEVEPGMRIRVIKLVEGTWLGFHDQESSTVHLGRLP